MMKLRSSEAPVYVKLQATHLVVAEKNNREIKDACEKSVEEEI
jgi:hypothetical protein